jgi:hypothetical protein
MPESKPSAEDYLHWLSAEVSGLPEMFASVNENFASAAIEGALAMARDFVDLGALQTAAADSGVDILPRNRVCEGPHGRCQRSGGVPSATIMCWLLFELSMIRYLFACILFCFNLMIMTLLLAFQVLLNKKEVAENVNAEAVSDD